MCGLAGFLSSAWSKDEAAMREAVGRMTDSLVHRGPDDAGLWVACGPGSGSSPGAAIALGHRRLSIVDLSPAGHQPMQSACGRFVIAYNGEVYNFPELRRELEGRGARFRGGSDTEVILEACAAFGVQEAVSRLIGMFAFALWDREHRRLFLVRDRLGIKPLFWGRAGGDLLFGSELKALRAFPGARFDLDHASAASFMRHGYVPAPHSIYRGVSKVRPGCILEFSADASAPVEHVYWDMQEVALAGLANRRDPGDEAAIDALDALLRDAVGRRMVADVPLGAFLSGGIDSSTVVALMQAQSDRPVKTFSIGFDESGYDEAQHAAVVAKHLGTDHTELYVEPQSALDVIPSIPDFYDEPFADSSQIPTFLVSRLAREQVTVSLSGDGGDELFAGYNRYVVGERFYRMLWRHPRALRRAMAAGLDVVPPRLWDTAFGMAPARWRIPQPADKARKLAAWLREDENAMYRRLVSHWTEKDGLTPGVVEHRGILWDDALRERIPDFVERMQFLDTVTYLPDDILTKVDRASMSVSLEARVPLLDHRVVEHAWRLPRRFRIRGNESKWLLRQVLYRYVPRELVERPKMGFGVPIDRWLRVELRDWAETLLGEERLAAHGFLDVEVVRRRWREHLEGGRNWSYPLWNVLMFQAWSERWLDAS